VILWKRAESSPGGILIKSLRVSTWNGKFRLGNSFSQELESTEGVAFFQHE